MSRPRISLTIPPETLAVIDDLRGAVARERWIRDAVQARIERDVTEKVLGVVEQGRQLANRREDLIASGVDPSDLATPVAPLPQRQTIPDPIRVLTLGHEFVNVHGGKRCEFRGCGETEGAHERPY